MEIAQVLIDKLQEKKKQEELEILDIQAACVLLSTCLNYLNMADSKKLDNIKIEISKALRELINE